MAPASFAAAAQNAGSTPTRDEWSRRPNGATQTFRRSSASTSMSNINQQQDPSSAQAPPRYVPPHRNGTVADNRYSKDQLLDLFRAQQASEGGLRDGLPGLYVGGWQPDISNGAASAGWGRTEHSRDGQPGPDICWDRDGMTEPLGLRDLDDEEREIFSTSVNTPLKPPSTANKDNQASNGISSRKVSLSGQIYSPGAFGPMSPTASRGPGRRRDTSESYPFPSTNTLASPTGGFNRDDQRAPSPPPSLTRRRTDLKDLNTVSEKGGDGDEKATSSPFGSLRRNPTGPLSAGFGAPSSPWSNAPQSAGLSPMGSFGNFGLGQQPASNDKRSGLGGGRAESRFKNLLSKDSTEEPSTRSVERKASVSSLSRVNENESWRPQPAQEPSTAPVDELEEDMSSGTGQDYDVNLQQAGGRGFGTPSRTQSRDDLGFGAFGMTPGNAQGSGQGFMQGQHAYQQTPAQQQRQLAGHEPMSPTDTNPFKSPEQHGMDRLTADMEGDQDDMHAQLRGLGGFGGDQQHQQFGGLGGLGALPNLGRAGGPQAAASDRSQTSSVAGNRGFPGLGGLGQMGGQPGSGAWPASQGGFGTPGRPTPGLSNAFGGGIFATSMAEMQSPGLAGLGSPGMFGPQSATGLGGRAGGLFSPTSQEQMRQAEQQRDVSGDRGGQPPFSGQGEAFGSQYEQELSGDQPPGQFGAPGQLSAIGQSTQQQAPVGQGQQQGGGGQPPAPQQRTMVMPDRMRWIYKDPSGNMQGPWTGLEMHDWYKAGFFSPELLVKKYEDPEYEPLAQLIRRIGNSREPFLVPQIGIPYGQGTAASAAPSSTWVGTPSTTATTGPTPTGAQPPFASSFPSFGTTLTAEQQNALERRKQEEQYLMARQKEHLAQQQIAQRLQHQQHGAPGGMSQHGGLAPGSSQLHHHSSAQSLHSQPSFGSMTSPPSGPFQPSPTQAAQGQGSGFYEQTYRGGQGGGLGAVGAGVDTLGHIREEEIPGIMDRLNLGNQAQGQFGAPGQPLGGQQMQSPPAQEQHDRQVQQMLQERARLQLEQAAHDAQQTQANEQPTKNERLQQFHQLQGQAPTAGLDARFQPAIGKSATEEQSSIAESSVASPAQPAIQQEMSLKERIQQTQSNQQSPAPQQPGLPQPFPPAPSQSPLPAPAAQRTGRTSVADQLQTEQRDLSQTPSVETPSAAIAPWAKEPTEAQKGPSLKEIQAIEAKKAAELEEMAAANRRAAFQREMEAQAQAATTTAPAPGLPASASWGAAASPATPTGTGASAWAKAAQKSTASATAKSMAQIQKEEEARKRKLAAAAAQAQATAMAGVSAPAIGKSYANLAGKISIPAPAQNAAGSAWTTVGAGGKPKTPAAAPAAPAPARTASTTMASAQAAATARKMPSRSTTMTGNGGVNAHEEFRKWAIGELRPDLNKGYSADDVVATLTQLPAETEIITEVVHGASSTIDSRHFAEEFLRRKRLADKGLVDTSAPQKSASPAGAGSKADQGGGWSEVAKKGGSGGAVKEGMSPVGGASEQGNGAFRVVPSKKKGGKR